VVCGTGQTEGDIGYDERDFYDTEYDSASGQLSFIQLFHWKVANNNNNNIYSGKINATTSRLLSL